MTVLDEHPALDAIPCDWSVAFLVQALDAAEFWAQARERLAYEAGFTDGHHAGAALAEADIVRAWARLAARIRTDADRLKRPVPEPAIRSQHDDAIWFSAAELDDWAGAR